ncbi:MAG: DUF4097 family beta strand repeat protein [bacterium]|nr:MAG: DUF4097 family beta strand repeat protein [bacterium]
MKRGMTAVIPVIILLLVCCISGAGWGEEVQKTFEGIKEIEINTVSGDCIIKTHRSDEVIVDLFYDVEPKGAFKYKIKESGKTLLIKERWGPGSSQGEVTWTLTVPAETEIEFSSASGDLTASGLTKAIETSTASGDIDIEDFKGEMEIAAASGDIDVRNAHGEIEISTASGDIKIRKSGGEIELNTASGEIDAVDISDEIDLNTASGDIEVSDSKGVFELNCASGSITAKGITIEGMSGFSTASGEVEIILAETSEYDLELSSASGDVCLDYNGNPVKGFFEFTARKRRGRISCPFDFDDEEEFDENGHTYVRKSFSRKGDTPTIYLSTASGKAQLKK